jgi:hypothetical protein
MTTNKEKYNKKYGFPKGTSHSIKDISNKTGIAVRILNQVMSRGRGARKSNPSSVRNLKGVKGGPGPKMSGTAWGFGRIFSFVTKQKGTWGGADSDLSQKVKAMKIKGYMK